jgi:hypothetical protein
MMTPLQIKMMLHYYAIAAPYAEGDPLHANSDAVHEQRGRLVLDELLYCDPKAPAVYVVTERGRVYVEGLCLVPLPVKNWAMP